MLKQTDLEDTLLAEVQGQIFEKSCEMGLDSEIFANNFMRSQTAFKLDLPHHKIRWSGEMVALYDFLENNPVPKGETWNSDAMFWIGFTWRLWNLMTEQKSSEIVSIADAGTMMSLYPKLHTDSIESAVVAIADGRARPDIHFQLPQP